MARSTAARLAAYQRRYRQLAEQVAEIGFISSGSVTLRYTRCGTPGCRCHADPPQRHGPYYQWTTKPNGKTQTRRLTDTEATLYEEWIANDRRLRAVIKQMRELAAKAAELKIKQAASAPPQVQSQAEDAGRPARARSALLQPCSPVTSRPNHVGGVNAFAASIEPNSTSTMHKPARSPSNRSTSATVSASGSSTR